IEVATRPQTIVAMANLRTVLSSYTNFSVRALIVLGPSQEPCSRLAHGFHSGVRFADAPSACACNCCTSGGELIRTLSRPLAFILRRSIRGRLHGRRSRVAGERRRCRARLDGEVRVELTPVRPSGAPRDSSAPTSG